MSKLKFNHLLAGTALALVLAVTASPLSATTETQAPSAALTEPAKESPKAAPEATTPTTPVQPETPAAAPAEPVAPSAATPPPATAATPSPAASTLSATDQAVSERMRDVTSGKYDRTFANKKERAAVEAWYATRNFAPLWITD